jgi:hypothetical protein
MLVCDTKDDPLLSGEGRAENSIICGSCLEYPYDPLPLDPNLFCRRQDLRRTALSVGKQQSNRC